jgi:hypothetical protein
MGTAVVVAAAPALAANAIDIVNASPGAIGVDYSCDSSAGVTGVRAMLGGATADRPAAEGIQKSLTCDGNHHSATIALTAAPDSAPMPAVASVQVRVALVDQNDVVVSGQAKAFTLK